MAGEGNELFDSFPEDAAWLAALLRLRTRRLAGEMPAAQHARILDVFGRVHRAVPSIRRPLLAPTEEGAYQLVWSFRDRAASLEIEVERDASIRWLFLDRVDGSAEGTEEPSPALPDRVLSLAARLA